MRWFGIFSFIWKFNCDYLIIIGLRFKPEYFGCADHNGILGNGDTFLIEGFQLRKKWTLIH